MSVLCRTQQTVNLNTGTAIGLLIALGLVQASPAGAQETAIPSGGSVVSGTATISADSGSGSLFVEQSSRTAVLSWNSFSVGGGATAHFNNGSGATLNRVTGNVASTIDGSLSATGSLFVINPAGVVVGTDGTVATGGSFVASTQDVSDADFLDGGAMTFSGASKAEVVNGGTIRSAHGDVALIARRVANAGTIEAPNGTVALAAGYKVLMRDEAGADGKFSVEIGGADTEAVNTGDVKAATIEIRANGGNVYALAGNTNHVVKATGVRRSDGRIFLTAGNTGHVRATQKMVARRRVVTKTIEVPLPIPRPERGGDIRISGGAVDIGGEIVAAGRGADGGTIVVTGDTLSLLDATSLDVSGTTGGTILVGGDFQGGANTDENLLPGAIATAKTLDVAEGAALGADGTAGDGGNIVLWSDDHTAFAGQLSATGGGATGNGGSAEVSGKQTLAFTGTVDLTAANGTTGDLLLDPYNVTISNDADRTSPGFTATANDSVINVDTLEIALQSANVTVSTGSGGSQDGDITVTAALSWSSGSTLTLDAAHAISILAPITIGGDGGLALNFYDDEVIYLPPGPFVSQENKQNLSFGLGPSGFAGTVDFGTTATGGTLSVNGDDYTLLYSMADVQAINDDLGGHYALATSLDASGVSDWTPIGSVGDGTVLTPDAPFDGTFEGLGHTISNLTVDRPTEDATGMFGVTKGGEIRDFGLVCGSVRGRSQVGGLLGYGREVTITHAFNSGSVEALPEDDPGGDDAGESVGGLVGASSASHIQGSYATGAVTGQDKVGGLVGAQHAAPSAATIIRNSYATGAVSSQLGAGGLVGQNNGYVFYSYATGNVHAGIAGGLVGTNYSSITDSYATGEVIADTTAGGLIGISFGAVVQDSYATGDVSGTAAAGGLVGLATAMILGSDGTFRRVFATGSVTADPDDAGGLFGYVTGTAISDSYWDTSTTGVETAAGGSNSTALLSNVVGLSTAEWLTHGPIAEGVFDTTTWVAGYPYPVLKALPYFLVNATGTQVYGDTAPNVTVSGATDQNGSDASGRVDTSTTSWVGCPTCDVRNGAVFGGTGGTADPGYQLTYVGTMSITPAHVAVTANSGSSVYGENPSNVGLSATGLRNGEGVSVLTGLSNSFDIDHTTDAGGYTLSVDGTLTNGNYTIDTRNTGTWTVTPRAITITADDNSRVYGDANPALTWTVGGMGLVNGDALSGALATAADAASDVGDYAINQGTLAASANYYVATFTPGRLSVTPRPITITAHDPSRIYGEANPALTWTVGGMGLVNGDALSGTLATAADAASNVGSHAITQRSLAASANYDVTAFTPGTLSVTQRALTVTADAVSRIYGEANPATGTATGDNLVNGDTIASIDLSSPATAESGIGAYDLSASNASGTGLSNYAISYAVNADGLRVTPRPITITADDISRVYGEANPALTWTVGGMGLVNGDRVSGALATAADGTSDVGAYAITQGTLAASANYDVATVAPGTLSVTQRSLTVTADDLWKIFGAPVPSLTASVTGGSLAPFHATIAEALSDYAMSTSASQTSPIGSYAVRVTGTNGNYALTLNDGTLSIVDNPARPFAGVETWPIGAPGSRPFTSSGPASGGSDGLGSGSPASNGLPSECMAGVVGPECEPFPYPSNTRFGQWLSANAE